MLRVFRDLVRVSGTTPVRHRAAVALLVLSSVAVSVGGLIVRHLEAASPWQFNVLRGAVGGVALLLVLLVQHRGALLASFRRLESPAWYGAGCLGLAALFYVLSLTRTTVANTHFVMSVAPFVTAGLAWLILGERLRLATLAAMGAAFAGVALMLVEGLAADRSSGIWFALMAVALFSTYGVIARGMRDTDLLPALVVASFVTMAGGLAGSLGDLDLSARDVALGVLWGLLVGLFGDWCFTLVVRHVSAAESMLLLLMLPAVLGPLWVWLAIDERPSLATLGGGALVLLALAGWALRDLRGR